MECAQVTENKDYGPRPKYRKQQRLADELSSLSLPDSIRYFSFSGWLVGASWLLRCCVRPSARPAVSLHAASHGQSAAHRPPGPAAFQSQTPACNR